MGIEITSFLSLDLKTNLNGVLDGLMHLHAQLFYMFISNFAVDWAMAGRNLAWSCETTLLEKDIINVRHLFEIDYDKIQ